MVFNSNSFFYVICSKGGEYAMEQKILDILLKINVRLDNIENKELSQINQKLDNIANKELPQINQRLDSIENKDLANINLVLDNIVNKDLPEIKYSIGNIENNELPAIRKQRLIDSNNIARILNMQTKMNETLEKMKVQEQEDLKMYQS